MLIKRKLKKVYNNMFQTYSSESKKMNAQISISLEACVHWFLNVFPLSPLLFCFLASNSLI